MKKISISDLILSLTLLIFGVVFSVFVSIPKTVMLHEFLQKKEIYVLANGAKEGLFSVNLFKGSVSFRGKEVGSFDSFKLDLLPPSADVTCGKGRIKVNLLSKSVSFKEFSCLKDLSKISGKLKFKEKGLEGKITLEGINTEMGKIERVSLTFKGETFKGRILFAGQDLEGGGRIKLDWQDLANSRVEATFSGNLGKVRLSGSLKDLKVNLLSP